MSDVTTFRMPPKSDWYVHLYRDKTTKLVHAVACIRRNYKRKPRSRANCGALLTGMWPRPPEGEAITCPQCLSIYDALDQLLEED